MKVLDFGVAKVNLLGDWNPPERTGLVPPPIPSGESETVMMRAPAEEIETVAIARTPSGLSSGSFDSGAGAQTMPGSVLGTPAYMSPEQAFGREIDFRSDIYSLAVVAYSLTCGQLPFTGKSSDLFEYHESGIPIPPYQVARVPRDVSDAIMAGLARNPADRPGSAIEFTRRFHNAVDAEFLALRRSKAFLLQHLTASALLLLPIYTTVVTLTALLIPISGKALRVEALRAMLIPLTSAVLFIFFDNLLRAAAALMAADERIRVRRFLSFRVFWRLVRMLPRLAATQMQAAFFFGRGWIVGDCLWPVVCVVESLSGRAAVQRSRELMNGLRSAGRALAIRHLALAAFAIADAIRSIGVLWRHGSFKEANAVVTASWFPIFALFAAAPLFLYDRTAASENGPLLQLDRTPEVRTTARALSLSSLIWLSVAVIDLFYDPITKWIFGAR